jgi:hypothetical protein
MFKVIGVKERTRGLATEVLGGRNMHVWGTPPTFPPEYSGEAFICFDRPETSTRLLTPHRLPVVFASTSCRSRSF